MKTYGKEPESLNSIIQTMLSDLAEYPIEKIMLAFKTHAVRSSEFPTTADLVGLIKRNGRPPLKESDVIAIRKKDGQDRTREDWDTLKAWDAQQSEEWEGGNPFKKQDNMDEICRLKAKISDLEKEVKRAWAYQIPKKEEKCKVQKTIDYLKSINAPQSDIDSFLQQHNA